jgi:anti-sigma regulatory factor (Ser/Thr protein kinase)
MTTNLLDRPVTGSLVQSLRPTSPQPRAAWYGHLKVSTSAAEQARHQARWFLRNNRDALAEDVIDDAVLLVSELVTNAHNAMSTYDALAGQAPRGTIDFSLRLFHDRLLIEVIDTSRKAPVLKLPCDSCEVSGRGLGIVQSLSDDWGYFWHHGRKVVYAILPVGPDAKAP